MTEHSTIAPKEQIRVTDVAHPPCEPLQRGAWNSAMAHWQDVWAQYKAAEAADDEAERDVFSEAVADAESTLMDTPAPDMAALCWKLDKLFETRGGNPDETPGWDRRAAQSTINDYHRLLGGPSEGVDTYAKEA